MSSSLEVFLPKKKKNHYKTPLKDHAKSTNKKFLNPSNQRLKKL